MSGERVGERGLLALLPFHSIMVWEFRNPRALERCCSFRCVIQIILSTIKHYRIRPFADVHKPTPLPNPLPAHMASSNESSARGEGALVLAQLMLRVFLKKLVQILGKKISPKRLFLDSLVQVKLKALGSV